MVRISAGPLSSMDKRLLVYESATVAINALVAAKKAAGERVHNLGVGEAILPTPEIILSAAEKAMRAGKTLYSPVAGIPELRSAAAAWINRWYGSDYSAEETIVTPGGKFAVYALLQALLEEGGEVIIIAPYWVSYPALVSMAGGISKIVNTRPTDGWRTSVSALTSACSSKTRAIILNNGSNPTGVLYAREEVGAILRLAEERNLTVISDEVYSGLTYGSSPYASTGSFPEYRERVCVVQSCSKHFAMTGWRVGFLFAPRETAEAVKIIQGQSTSGAATVSQWAALSAIENADFITAQVRDAVARRREVFLSSFEKHFGVRLNPPAAGLYCFFPLLALGSSEMDDIEFCRLLLKEANVALVPGSAFGAPGWVRASFGGPEDEIRATLERLFKYC